MNGITEMVSSIRATEAEAPRLTSADVAASASDAVNRAARRRAERLAARRQRTDGLDTGGAALALAERLAGARLKRHGGGAVIAAQDAAADAWLRLAERDPATLRTLADASATAAERAQAEARVAGAVRSVIGTAVRAATITDPTERLAEHRTRQADGAWWLRDGGAVLTEAQRAERAQAVRGALAADGRAERIDHDHGRGFAIPTAAVRGTLRGYAEADAATGGASTAAQRAEHGQTRRREAVRREARTMRRIDEQTTAQAVRLIRETSLEALLTEAHRISHTIDPRHGASADRVWSAAWRRALREALRGDLIGGRARSARLALATSVTAAEAERRTERLIRARALAHRVTEAEAERLAAAEALALADGSEAVHLEREAERAQREAERQAQTWRDTAERQRRSGAPLLAALAPRIVTAAGSAAVIAEALAAEAAQAREAAAQVKRRRSVLAEAERREAEAREALAVYVTATDGGRRAWRLADAVIAATRATEAHDGASGRTEAGAVDWRAISAGIGAGLSDTALAALRDFVRSAVDGMRVNDGLRDAATAQAGGRAALAGAVIRERQAEREAGAAEREALRERRAAQRAAAVRVAIWEALAPWSVDGSVATMAALARRAQ